MQERVQKRCQDMLKVTEWIPEVSKSEPKAAKVRKWIPEVSKSEPKGATRDPLGPRGAKVEAKRVLGPPKGSQKGTKGRPKCIPKLIFGKGC